MILIADLCSNLAPFLEHVLLRSVERAVASGATHVKVQVFTRSHFPRAERDAKRSVEFPRRLLPTFVDHVHDLGGLAGASVFDEHAVDACVDAGVDFLKLATREAFNTTLVDLCADTGLPTFTSIPLGLEVQPWRDRRPNETFLACIPQYPTLDWQVEGALAIFRRKQPAWGWSSHTPHYQDVMMAVAAGATVVEKHLMFTPMDPEAAWSLSCEDFWRMVDAIEKPST
jgi:sialic acid synthase SpsE